jgi:hypothetical protein
VSWVCFSLQNQKLINSLSSIPLYKPKDAPFTMHFQMTSFTPHCMGVKVFSMFHVTRKSKLLPTIPSNGNVQNL